MRKIKKHGNPKIIAIVRSVKTRLRSREEIFTKREEQILSISDRVAWVYKVNKKRTIKEVTTVSYVANINGIE